MLSEFFFFFNLYVFHCWTEGVTLRWSNAGWGRYRFRRGCYKSLIAFEILRTDQYDVLIIQSVKRANKRYSCDEETDVMKL